MSNPQRVGLNTNVKQFNTTKSENYWKYIKRPSNTLEPNILNANLHVRGNLIVDGSISNPSDINVKDNLVIIDGEEIHLTKLSPIQYTYNNDETKQIHYGLSAQELEKYYPCLVNNTIRDGSEIKVVNYIELIPLLLVKIKSMEKEIKSLKENEKIKTETKEKSSVSYNDNDDIIYRTIAKLKTSVDNIKSTLQKRLKIFI